MKCLSLFFFFLAFFFKNKKYFKTSAEIFIISLAVVCLKGFAE